MALPWLWPYFVSLGHVTKDLCNSVLVGIWSSRLFCQSQKEFETKKKQHMKPLGRTELFPNVFSFHMSRVLTPLESQGVSQNGITHYS